MSKTSSSEPNRADGEDDLRPEYEFDYARARPNRFANSPGRRLVMLDGDVAAVFRDAAAVNHALRSLAGGTRAAAPRDAPKPRAG